MTQYYPVFFDIETTGLNPMAQHWWDSVSQAAQVTCVTVGTVNDWQTAGSHEDCHYELETFCTESEYELLSDLRDYMERLEEEIEALGYVPLLVTFNGRNFDHPYLGARYARLRLNGEWFSHKWMRLDMMRALGKSDFIGSRYPSEDDCLEVAGIPTDDEFDGSDMPGFFEDGQLAKIRSHAEADVEEMMRLFVETRNICMAEFFDHYDIERDANYREEVDL